MTRKLNIDIIAKDKSRQALKQVQGNLDNTKKSILNVKNALIGLGVGLAARSIINVGKEVENLQVRFKFLFGSIEEGSLAFDNLSKFASQVPFSLEEITAASGNLAVVAKDANDLNRILEITGNVAAVTGLDFATAGSQIQRAFSGGIAAADIFREKGVRQLLGFKEGAKVSIDETVAAFEEAFSGDGKFAQATEELAQTLTGTTSMLQDKLFNFQKTVSDQFVGTLTDELGDLNQYLEDNRDTINEIATLLGKTLANSIILLGKSLTTTKSTMDKFNIGVRDLLLDVVPLGFGLGTIREEFPELANAIDEYLDSQYPANDAIKDFNELIEQSSTAMGNASKVLSDMTTKQEEFVSKLNIDKILEQIDALKKEQQQLLYLSKGFSTVNTELGRFAQHNQDNSNLIDTLNQSKFPRFVQVLEEAGNTTKQLDELFTNTFNGFADTLADSLMTGKFAFKDFARSVLRDIARMIARQQALLILQRASGFFGGSSGGIMSSVGKIFGFANGGTPPVNKPSLVGERGAELFIPKSSGTIIPNEQLPQMAGTTNINFTINTVDAQGVDELLTNRRSTIINVINDALNRQGKEALV
jgi:methyl-accepting chemotaxis protein